MTTTAEAPGTKTRPDPPLRMRRMIIPIFVGVTGFVLGGFLGDILFGILWGVVAAAGLLIAFRLGTIDLSNAEAVMMSGAIIASTILSTRVMPEAPQDVDVLLALGYALAWLPAGAAAGVFAHSRGVRPSTALGIASTWIAGAAIAIPA